MYRRKTKEQTRSTLFIHALALKMHVFPLHWQTFSRLISSDRERISDITSRLFVTCRFSRQLIVGPSYFQRRLLGATYGERFMCHRQCNEFISNLLVVVRGEPSVIEDLSLVPLNQAFF